MQKKWEFRTTLRNYIIYCPTASCTRIWIPVTPAAKHSVVQPEVVEAKPRARELSGNDAILKRSEEQNDVRKIMNYTFVGTFNLVYGAAAYTPCV